MKIIRQIPENFAPSVLALGNFDGLHPGHIAVLKNAIELAAQNSASPVVFTFDPEPDSFLHDRDPAARRLLTKQDKLRIIEGLGFEKCLLLKFSAELARLTPKEFIWKVLVRRLNVRGLSVGYDFKFGHGGCGNIEKLQRLASEAGFELEVCSPVEKLGEPVSSSRVRKLIKQGEVEQAAQLLERPYTVFESIKTGRGIGRQLGFPTLNFTLRNTLKPLYGVYLVWLGTEERIPAVANFGVAPTFGLQTEPYLEVHSLDNRPDFVVGESTHIYFEKFLRAEMKFDSKTELIDKISQDVAMARTRFSGLNRPRPLYEQKIFNKEEYDE